MPVLANLSGISYRVGDRTILSNFSLSIRKGERVLLSGPSGSGKTSVIRLLVGLASPDTGRRHVNLPAGRISYLPQDADLSEDRLSDFYRSIYGWRAHSDRHYDRSRAAALLSELGLPAAALDTSYRELSGGERQRALLALALMLDKPLNILDEPSSGLDQASAREVFKAVTEQLSGAVLVVSHDEVWEQAPFRLVSVQSGDDTNGGMSS